LLRIEPTDYGWLECCFDNEQRKLVLAPEYGGDGGKAVGPRANKQGPIAFYPAHWAPNALVFYLGEQFPSHCRGGAFIAFHGSWNRAPLPQEGYNAVFQPFENGKPVEPYEVFADSFAGAIKEPGAAAHRPAGLAVGPDGALYISDDAHGAIWRVVYDPARAPKAQVLPSASATGSGEAPEPRKGSTRMRAPIQRVRRCPRRPRAPGLPPSRSRSAIAFTTARPASAVTARTPRGSRSDLT